MALEKEDIMALIAILQKGLTDDEEGLHSEEPPPRKKKSQKTTKTRMTNKFDSMSERNMHKQDSKIDKLLWGETHPTDRGRPSTLIQVRCRVCGKSEQVSSSMIESPERYKCNKCAATSG